jgi:hypothetical protein
MAGASGHRLIQRMRVRGVKLRAAKNSPARTVSRYWHNRRVISEIARSRYGCRTNFLRRTRRYHIVVFGVARSLPAADKHIRYQQAERMGLK